MVKVHPQRGYINTYFTVNLKGNEHSQVSFRDSKTNEEISLLVDKLTDNLPIVKVKFLSVGKFYICINDEVQDDFIVVEDAIKLGGSTVKASYVDDASSWAILVMKDRTYFYNVETGESYAESFSPDSIQFINNDIILLESDQKKQRTLYSLSLQERILDFSDFCFLDNHTLVIQKHEQGKQFLNVYSFKDAIEDQISIETNQYSIDEEFKILYVLNSPSTVQEFSLINFELLHTYTVNYNHSTFIKFTNKHYALLLRECDATTEFLLYDLQNKTQVGLFSSNEYVESVEGSLLHESNLNLGILYSHSNFSEKIECMRRLGMPSFCMLRIEKIFIINYITYFWVYNEQIHFDEKGAPHHYDINQLFCQDSSQNNILIGQYHSYTRISKIGDQLVITDLQETQIIENGKVSYVTRDIPHIHKDCIIFSKRVKGIDSVYTLLQNTPIHITDAKIDWSVYSDFGVVYFVDEKVGQFLTSDSVLVHKPSDYFSCNYLCVRNNILYTNGHPISIGGRKIKNLSVDFPENLNSVSQTGERAISIRGAHVYYHKINQAGNKPYYDAKEILTELYDASGYKNVLMTDDGTNILYEDEEDMFLMDVNTKQKVKFKNLSFVSHVNGYKPLIELDSHRHPILIDPLTKQKINTNYLSQYDFVSPDLKKYVASSMKDCVKYFNTLTHKYLNDDEYKDLCMKYNSSSDFVDRRIYENRCLLVNEFPDSFFKVEQNDLQTRIDFLSTFIEECGVIKVKDTSTHQILNEILLESKLWFLNYVSFSYDSRYVAIAGKYPESASKPDGLFIVYDLKENMKICEESQRKAVWLTAFTKDNYIGSYTSNPTSMVRKIEDISFKDNFTIKDRNFLTFSPDGQYCAFSEQGYIPYDSEKSYWGHQPSTRVFVRKTKNADKDSTESEFDDLAQGGIEGAYEKSATVVSVSFSTDNSKLMMVGKDKTVIIRNLHLNDN